MTEADMQRLQWLLEEGRKAGDVKGDKFTSADAVN